MDHDVAAQHGGLGRLEGDEGHGGGGRGTRRGAHRGWELHRALESQVVEAHACAACARDVHIERRCTHILLPRKGRLLGRLHLVHDARVLELGTRRLRDDKGVRR